mmetsp:Transcript_9650/g.20361  ORF Transcript_9650/g.20361 Transcript_9650/m.20361 type:complete len:95 (+) Transcript_9650:232-516(+)
MSSFTYSKGVLPSRASFNFWTDHLRTLSDRWSDALKQSKRRSVDVVGLRLGVVNLVTQVVECADCDFAERRQKILVDREAHQLREESKRPMPTI